ncbi:hypothetical protein F383_27835 [Gossypium arboreum]|uniref:Uncharacterized protein n=1 Tax=Gossypium arboreum TaxID=29729 RepID=A0A0B0P9T6_GOSAR|nr:hypothetical protein F383_27835 [Gossypium arboreum]
MDQSTFLEQFPSSFFVPPSSTLLGCIYMLWNAQEPSKLAFSELD